MVMADEPEKKDPRWDIINILYDAIDSNIVEISEKNKMNFIEISLALQMVNKKIEYEQFKAMFEFNVEGLKEGQEKQPDGMYR
jgi:hypothetical protein